ncbi:MAG TPA: tripartite tricarboxylate transporter substrate binding protein [Ramlibacter sp.]|nr:tripartite tricarboxylate transporter substrate binding protein [Ramlibacter sp.]
MRSSTRRLVLAAGLLGLATATQAAGPAAFPNRPVRIIVPFPAGGTTDALPRILAEKLSTKWGQPVIVENRPGVGGNIGAELAFRADPDGHTLLVSAPGPLVVSPSLFKKLSYEPGQLTPITLIGTMPNLLATRPGLPAGSLQELIAFARKNPGRITYASQGNGTTSHLSASLFQQLTGTQMVHVPYKGTAPALTDLMGGQVDILFDNVTSSIAYYKGGRIKVLAVATDKRLPTLPEIPTAEEAGLKGFVTNTFVAMLAPPNTPPAIAAQIHKAVVEVVRMPDVQKKFAELGVDTVAGSEAELAKYLAGETARWRSVIQRANVTVD